MLRTHTLSPPNGSNSDATTMRPTAVTARPRPAFFVSTVVVAVSPVSLMRAPIPRRPREVPAPLGDGRPPIIAARHPRSAVSSARIVRAPAPGPDDDPPSHRYGSAMLIAGTDGSEASIAALRTGLAVVAPD